MLFEEWGSSSGSSRQVTSSSRPTGGGFGGMGRGNDDDDYSSDDERAGGGGGGGGRNQRSPSEDFDPSALNLTLNDDEEGELPMFRVQKMDFALSRDQGSIVSVDVGSNLLYIACSNGTIVRWALDDDSFETVVISKRGETIHAVHVDPTGKHCLVSMTSGQNYYVHVRRKKAVLCQKVRGMVVESVAWNVSECTDDSSGRILLGSTKGLLYETQLEDKKGDKFVKRLCDLAEDSGAETPVAGLKIELFPSSTPNDPKYLVMASTPTRFYQFIGGPTFEAVFARYANVPAFVELPGDLDRSELRFFSRYHSRTSVSESMAWLTGAGVYYGNLAFGSQSQPGERVVDDGKLLGYPTLAQDSYEDERGRTQQTPPQSLILTEFHFLLLSQRRLVCINRLSEEIVFSQTLERGRLLGLCNDARKGTVWMYSDRGIFEVEIEAEDRDVWRLYLQDSKFAQALDFCYTDAQREQVHNAHADHLFAEGQYERAAEYYAKTGRSFEEIALKFSSQRQQRAPLTAQERQQQQLLAGGLGLTPQQQQQQQQQGGAAQQGQGGRAGVRKAAKLRNALKTYLKSRLEGLSPQDLTQSTMLCTWLTEIYLDSITALERARHPPNSPHPMSDQQLPEQERRQLLDQEIDNFQAFLEDYHDCLNRQTTFDLISSHGRNEELLFYAGLIHDLEWVLQHHLQQHDYEAALSLLASHDSPGKIASLYYRFAPTLMQHLPSQTVDMLTEARMSVLDPVKLVPALMRYQATHRHPPVNQAVRFLEACVQAHNKDPAIHNYLVSLYARQEDELPLLRFIDTFAHDPLNTPVYDYKHALRLCHAQGKIRSMVSIYTAMDLYDDALRLALNVDLELAKKIVQMSERALDDGERKRLWLTIAKHVIQRDEDRPDIATAMEILKESQLRLEDVLPYFPDFVKIGEFKAEICKSLEAYNAGIEALKQEMEDFTESANLIRQDINQLRNRSAYLVANQKCDLCRQPVLTRQFMLFPCEHAFHTDCVTNQVLGFLKARPELMDEVCEKGKHPDEDMATRAQRERKQIEAYAAGECVLCGVVMIESVAEPFVDPYTERDEIKSWELEL